MKTVLSAVWRYIKKMDKLLLLLAAAAGAIGVFMLYSQYENGFTNISAFKTQLLVTVAGVVCCLVVTAIDYKFIAKMWFLYAPVALVLVLLLFTPMGIQREGTDDIGWLNFFGLVTFQPSEILKIAFLLTFSFHLSKIGDKINKIPHLLLLLLHAGVPVLIIAKQGDDGTALVFLFMAVCMLFAAGLSWKYIVAGCVGAPLIVVFAWNFLMQPHQKLRFLVLFDEKLQEEQSQLIYYQQRLGKIALGSGQLTGKGLHADSYTYVPEIYNDFMFSYIGMTLGFIGCMAVVILLVLLCIKILSVSSVAKDPLGKYICTGVFSIIAFHSIVNIGMVLGVFPVIGIPLPFISAGGTSVAALYVSIGLVMSVYQHRTKNKHMFYDEED